MTSLLVSIVPIILAAAAGGILFVRFMNREDASRKSDFMKYIESRNKEESRLHQVLADRAREITRLYDENYVLRHRLDEIERSTKKREPK